MQISIYRERKPGYKAAKRSNDLLKLTRSVAGTRRTGGGSAHPFGAPPPLELAACLIPGSAWSDSH